MPCTVDMDPNSWPSLVGVLGLTAMPPRPVGRLMRTSTRTRAKRGPRRGSMCGGDRAPSAPVFAAVEADARRIAKRAARCPARCGTRRSVRGEPLPSRAVRSRLLSGGGACAAGARPRPAGGSAAAPAGEEGTLLAAGPREARSYFGCGQQFHVESPHLQSQQQTLSTASRVAQAWGAGRSAVGAREGRAGRGPGREVQEVRGSNSCWGYQGLGCFWVA